MLKSVVVKNETPSAPTKSNYLTGIQQKEMCSLLANGECFVLCLFN